MTKALVTGGVGFIGSHITDLLVEKDYEVIVVDNLSTGSIKNLNAEAVFYEADICEPGLRDIFKKEKPGFILHQAAQVSVRNSVSDPKFDASVNILGSINLLECCREFNVRKVIYASSGGAVYGEPQNLPVDENHPIQPLSPYGASKYSIENYLYTYRVNYGLDYTVLRYSNVYGPRQDPFGEAGVVAIFTERLLEDVDPVIHGDGNQTRDFVYVRDVADANLMAMGKKTLRRELNIGTGVETSVNDIYHKLKEITNSKASPVYDDPVPGEVKKIRLDIGLAQRELGWKPKINFDEGLKETVNWLKKKK
ncbi:MAG: GDP-mannose 4,6-dehydratase [Candidatus Altiarchaeota archaeon]|nr:GDP-mannose 4,6-dehydratase [Candidatus Altiarchaeota archaeon]